MKLKKTLALLCATALLGGSLIGCSQNKEESKPPENTSSGGSSSHVYSPSVPDTLDVSVYRPIFGDQSPDGLPVETKWHEMMDDYLGYSVSVTWEEVPYADYLQKLPVYLASGDWADIFTVVANDDQIGELGASGMLLALDDYIDSIPNYSKWLEDAGKNQLRTESPDGRMYGFCNASVSSITGTQCCFTVRFDAFKKHNIPMPTTMDEVYDSAKRLKELYPDSYPISGTYVELLSGLFAIENTSNTIYFDGEHFAYGPTDEKLKGLIAYMQKLYTEGLLDPEYATQTTDNLIQKALNDKVFISPFMYPRGLSDKINASSDTVEWGLLPHPKNLKGGTPWYPSPNVKGVWIDPYYRIVINSKTEHPELLMKLVDYQYSDEMVDLFNWGIEGLTYTVGADGTKSYTDEILNSDNVLTTMANYGINISLSVRSGIQFAPQLLDINVYTFPTLPTWINGAYGEMTCWQFYSDAEEDTGLCIGQPKEPVTLWNEDENTEKSNTMTPVDTFVLENLANFIAGEQDMSQWDAFTAEIKNYGDYEKIVAMYNKKMQEVANAN